MPESTSGDFLFRGDIAELDPEVADLIRHETARQARYLIMIPSESTVPQAVREALGSAFHNIYAEGYPLEETRTMTQAEILNYNDRLPEYRRFADLRYYKGTEYADIVEALARRRAAELFATPAYPAEKLYVNVQPLSGAPANSAIYTALINVGDTIMGLDLLQGGHLTHGSPVNRSGKFYNVIGYGVDPQSELLDYDAIRALAVQHRPKIIIAGYTSYPYAPDWHTFRAIADEVGAYLMADVAHVAGLIIAGAYPSPVGIADVVSFTTHKTLAGPRGAIIITHRKDVATKVDRGVFPGEQGGPHVNSIAGLAVALRLAYTDQFRQLQHQTTANAKRLVEKLTEHGIRVAYGGTDTHMLLIDCKTVVGADGTPLSGDQAARILDLAGIVANRNTIPGDPSALRASGVRFGTTWITQRGFGTPEIDRLAALIAEIIQACVPFSYMGKKRPEPRAKIDFEVLQRARRAIRDLSDSVGIDTDAAADDYPHFHYLDPESDAVNWQTLLIRGAQAAHFLDVALTSDVRALQPGGSQMTRLLKPDGTEIARGVLMLGSEGYHLSVEKNAGYAAAWLRSLSDGFVIIDPTDAYAKVPGPVDVQALGKPTSPNPAAQLGAAWDDAAAGYANKPYVIGINGAHYAGQRGAALPPFRWDAPEDEPLRTTPLHSLHQSLKAKMTAFAGYDMPVWYSSVSDEHQAVRSGAGIFDVTHMGVFDVRGAEAAAFLNILTTNDLDKLAVGESQYTYMLDLDGVPLDDMMIYRLADDHYMVVVNASNNDKIWAWLGAVLDGTAALDSAQPWRKFGGKDRVIVRDLRADSSGADQRVDVALQGPKSRDILLSLDGSDADKAKVRALEWAQQVQVTLGGFAMIVSRSGYTGERTAYELFVHPRQAVGLFKALITAGATPCGLAARDSLRTEAGLPLYGHELAGDLKLNPSDAGFGSYVKLWKPFFVGKQAFITHERDRRAQVTRFRLKARGARPPHPGDPVVDTRGRVVGKVTSCSIDLEGYQLGQAYLADEFLAEGTEIAIFTGAARAKIDAALNAVGMGDRVTVPEAAVVLSRYPKKK
jgi:glycine hydroxymethyltransferase